MAKFKVIVSDPTQGKSKVVELEGARAVPLIGKRLGDTLDGSVVGISGQKLQITGGSDKDGFPMRPNVHGGVRVNIILSQGVGFHPKREGERQRKTVRGNIITEEIVQVNMKVVEKPKRAERPKRERKTKTEATLEKKEAVEEAQTQPASVTTGGEPSAAVAQATRG